MKLPSIASSGSDPVRGGDTFLVEEPGTSYDSHLWIVLSDPNIDSDSVLIVNLTSWRADKDQACVLDAGDHPYVKHRSCVNYTGAKVVTAAHIERLLSVGKLVSHSPVDPGLLAKIRNSVLTSRMALGNVALVEEQGLIEA